MPKLKANLGGLAFAFESGFDELTNYLDLETGEIAVVTDDTRREAVRFAASKDVLLDYRQERERWFAFKDEKMIERVREWLAAHDIEPIDKGRGA